jgi:integrase
MIGKPTKRRRHGRLRWMVELRDERGRRRMRFFPTKAEADAHQAVVNQRPRVALHPIVLDSRATLRQYGAEWLAANATVWKPRTYTSAAALLAQHVYPFPVGRIVLGDVRLRDLDRAHVKALVVAKRRAGYAPDSVRLMFGTLRALLNEAVEDELLAFNPVATPGKALRRQIARAKETDQVKAMTADELDRFLTAAKRTSRLYVLYLAGARAGLRLGELCGWQLGDLRLEAREADVARSLGHESSRRTPTPGSTKTGRTRTVDLSAQLIAALATIVRERPPRAMAAGWRPVPPWVFVTSTGTPYAQRFVQRDFGRVLVAAKLMQKGEPAPFTPHSLRHTFACLHLTTATDRNVIQYVQQQLGHSSITVTVDTYGSWIRLRDPAAADRLDALVGTVSGTRGGTERPV